MSLTSLKVLRDAAAIIAPDLRQVVRHKMSLTSEDVRAAIVKARKEGKPIANLSSVRSLQIVGELFMEEH